MFYCASGAVIDARWPPQVVNDAGQIVAVPRRFLDPRRTYEKLTKDDQEEMLLPYDVVLPSDSRWIISSDYKVRADCCLSILD